MQTKYTAKDIARFWGKVDKEKSTTFYNGSRCWEWIGPCSKNGYGNSWIGNKQRQPHRVTYELIFGKIHNELFVLHHCDNHSCVNPDHLFLGTHKDNMEDMKKKGRQAADEKNGRCKLSNSQVSEIRRRYKRNKKYGESSYQLAKEFGVSPSQIQRIVDYRSRT